MSRALAVQVVLFTELPEHVDHSLVRKNGTHVNIHGIELENGNTSSLSAILFPVQDIPSGATHLPGLRGRTTIPTIFTRSSTNPLLFKGTRVALGKENNKKDSESKMQSDDSGIRDQYDSRRSNSNNDYEDESQSTSSRHTSSDHGSQDYDSSGDNYDSLPEDHSRPKSGSGKGSFSSRSDQEWSRGTRHQASDYEPSREEDQAGSVATAWQEDEEDHISNPDSLRESSSSRRMSNTSHNNRNRRPQTTTTGKKRKEYGSRRTPWGYPTFGSQPYPSTIIPDGKPVKTTSENYPISSSSPPHEDGNVFRKKPFPKPDQRSGTEKQNGFPATIAVNVPIHTDDLMSGSTASAVYPTVIESGPSQSGYEDLTSSDDDSGPQIFIVTTDDAIPYDSSIISAPGFGESVIEIPASAAITSSQTGTHRSTILLQRPTTSIFSTTTVTDGFIGGKNGDPHRDDIQLESMHPNTGSAGGTSSGATYIISRESSHRLHQHQQ